MLPKSTLTTCSTDGCDRDFYARARCKYHYNADRLAGDLIIPPAQTTTQLFWAKVCITPTCWLWRAATDRDGYGQVSFAGRHYKAHRISYEWLTGPIPVDLQIDHLCRVRNCVNPEHLEAVSSRVNTLRGDTLQAANAVKTHCPKGHAYIGSNVRVYGGSRQCVACSRTRSRLWYRQRRLAVANG